MTGLRCNRLVLATGNANKVRELSELLAPLSVPLLSLADFPNVSPVAENGATLAENARAKASGYARQIEQWVLADDTGLEVDALGGAPGVRSARFAGERATMAENRARLLGELKGVPLERRTARFVCHLALADPAGRIVAESTGACIGRLRSEPVGDRGFGYDSLFEVLELGRTLAELDLATTARISHRGHAVRNLLATLPRLLKPDGDR